LSRAAQTEDSRGSPPGLFPGQRQFIV